MQDQKVYARLNSSLLNYLIRLNVWFVTWSLTSYAACAVITPTENIITLRFLAIMLGANLCTLPFTLFTSIIVRTNSLVLTRWLVPDRVITMDMIRSVQSIRQHPFDKLINGTRDIVELELKVEGNKEQLRISVNRYENSEQLRELLLSLAPIKNQTSTQNTEGALSTS